MKPPEIPWPPHAYVPGRNARHDEAVFVAQHHSVQPDMDATALARTLAWRCAWPYISHGYYWEAHEVLEPVWMALPPNSVERQFVQGMIQLANAALKLEMKRPRATLRLCDIVDQHLAACGTRGRVMGQQLGDLQDLAAGLRERAILQDGRNSAL